MLIKILKVFLTIILVPLKAVFYIFAYAVKLITSVLSFFIMMLSIPFELIGALVLPVMSVGALGVTIVMINWISSGTTTLKDGLIIIIGIWLVTGLGIIISKGLETVTDGLEWFGDLLTDWANANWFAFW